MVTHNLKYLVFEIPKLIMTTWLGSSLLNYDRFRKGQIEVSPETNETSVKLINDQEYMDDTVSDLLKGGGVHGFCQPRRH